jgi:hypothetical protein
LEDNIKMYVEERGGGARTRFIWLKMGTVGGLYECGNELLGSIKCGDFFD